MSDRQLFGQQTVSWRVNHEPVIFLGAGRALLLQVAHPQVAAGVADHSDYKAHPWHRLYRTVNVTLKIAFGEGDISETATRALRRRHDHVAGVSNDGTSYRAQDPALLIWVWATLVDTSLQVFERCFGPLSQADRETFYQEQKWFAIACGVPDGECPETHADFAAYMDRMVAEELRVTRPARETAIAISRPNPWVLRPLGLPLMLFTAALLPPRIREQYELPWSRSRECLVDAGFATSHLGVKLVPRRLRQLPVVLAGGV